jgi:hypothetical protein
MMQDTEIRRRLCCQPPVSVVDALHRFGVTPMIRVVNLRQASVRNFDKFGRCRLSQM